MAKTVARDAYICRTNKPINIIEFAVCVCVSVCEERKTRVVYKICIYIFMHIYLSTHTHTAENKAAEWEREREREREIRGSWSSSLGLRAYGQHFYLSQVLHTFRRIFHIHSPCESVCACVCALSKRICVKERSVWALPRFVFSFFSFLGWACVDLIWQHWRAIYRRIIRESMLKRVRRDCTLIEEMWDEPETATWKCF